METIRKIYDRDFKFNAVLLSYRNGSLLQTARDLQISEKLLFLWRKDCKNYGTGSFPGYGYLKLNSEEKKIYNLEKKIKETDLKFEIIRNASKYICLGRPFLFHFIAENEKKYSTSFMCRIFGMQRKTYRLWKMGFINKTEKRKMILKKEISSIFSDSKETYGCRRISIVLQKSGYSISHTTVLVYMRELGLYVSVKKNNQAIRNNQKKSNANS
jgi:transposase-like protein